MRKPNTTKRLLIIAGSKNDIPHLKEVETVLKKAKVPVSLQIISVHRNVKILVDELEPGRLAAKNIGCVLVVAHSVANLPAIIAGYLKDTPIPVIGVGLAKNDADKIESLLSVISVPRGVPLVNAGINEVGLHNAALVCIKILKMGSEN